MFDSIKPAQDIHDFHQKISENKGKVRYTDYEIIQNIRKQDISEMKKILNANIEYNKTLKKPDGTDFTQEEINTKNKEWQNYLDTVNTLEQSWQQGTLKIDNHEEEIHKATIDKTKIKLKELFGEIQQTTPLHVPVQAPAPVQAPLQSPTSAPVISAPVTTTVTTPVISAPARIERRELRDAEVLARNKDYIKNNNIAIPTDATLQGYLDNPTRGNIKELQRYIRYHRTPDGIMGPITKRAIIKFLGKKEPGNDQNESVPNSNQIGFSRENGRIVLNARDTTGNIIQKLSYEDIMKLSGKESKLSETQRGELNQLILLSTIGDIWVQAASKDMDTMMFGSFRSGGKEEYKKQIGGISEYINSLQTKFQKGESIQGDIANAYNKFNFVNSSTGGLTPPIAINDLRRVLDMVQGGGSLDARRASILKTLSSKFDSTTTEAVKSTAMTEVLKMNDFKDLRTKFEDPAFMDQFIGASRDEMKAILIASPYSLNESGSKDLISEIEKTRAGINSRKNEIEKTLKQQGVAPAKIKEQVDGAEKIAVQLVISNHIIDSKINSLSGGFVDAYKQSKSDLTWNKAIDISVQLAISLVPMGAGLLAARGALALGRGAMAMRVGNVVPNMAKGNVGKFIGTSAVEGVGFYEGFNLTNNLIHNQDVDNKFGGLFEGVLDVKEIVKSIAMVGVIKGLGMIPGQKIDAILLKDPTKMKQFALEAGKVAGISAGVVGISQGVEAMFGEGFHPTPEEFAQAVIMTALFRKFSKSKTVETTKLPEGYELAPITSRKGINAVRTAQKADPNYQPEIVNSKGEVFLIESIKGSNGREILSLVNKVSGTKSKITPKDLLDSKWALTKKPESTTNVQNNLEEPTGKGREAEKSKKTPKPKVDSENKTTPQNQDKYDVIESRKGINIVRQLQKQNPLYKPEIVGPKGEVLVIENIQGMSGRERLQTSNKITGKNGEITVSEFISGKYRRLDVSSTRGEPKETGATESSSVTNKPTDTSEIGSKRLKTPNEIFEGTLSLKMKALQTEARIPNFLGMNIQDLSLARVRVEKFDVNGNKKVQIAKENLLSYLDSQISLKSPKQSFFDKASATKWIKENKGKIGAGVAIAVAGTIYLTYKTRDGNIEIRPAPQVSEGSITLVPQGDTQEGIIDAPVQEITITPIATTGSIDAPK